MRSAATGAELLKICSLSLAFVDQYADLIPLISKVATKQYVMARLKTGLKSSRPINVDLFDSKLSIDNIKAVLSGPTAGITETDLQVSLYSVAMSYLIARDLVSTGDKKSPGTFFEILIGHIIANRLEVNPTTSIDIPSLDIANRLPTDLIFDLGPGELKMHVPVKISTRERIVQAWAHQRVLEGMHGAGRFRGVMVILTETNKQDETSVVEVCLPGQWAAYQMYISLMHRVYYFDIPKPYEPLRDRYPFIPVLPFSRFFSEYQQLRMPVAY